LQHTLFTAMMKKLLFLSGIIAASAMPAQTIFQVAIGGSADESGRTICRAADGNFLIAAYTSSFVTSGSYEDFYVIKVDTSGQTLWTHSYGGSDMDMPRSIKPTPDGGFFVCGGTRSYTIGVVDLAVLRCDATGNVIWDKTYHVTGNETANAMDLTSDGGVIVAGEIYGSAYYDTYVIRLDSLGNLLWSKAYGSSQIETAQAVRQTADGGFVVCGTNMTLAGDANVYVYKTDSAGTLEWSKAYTSAGTAYGTDILETNEGGFIISGYGDSLDGGEFDCLLIRTDSAGNVLWSKGIGDVGTDYAYSIVIAADGGYLLTGFTTSVSVTPYEDVYALKTDAAGNATWQRAYGGNDIEMGNAAIALADGFVLTGLTTSFGTGSSDIYLIRTDASGNSGCHESTSSFPVTTINPVTAYAFGTAYNTTTNSSDPTFAVTQGGQTTVLCSNSPSAIAELQPGSATVYPNPFSDETTVLLSASEVKSVDIFDMAGRIATGNFTFVMTPGSMIVRNQTAAPGVYFMSITWKNNRQEVIRLVIE
jgi:hypothetical protein